MLRIIHKLRLDFSIFDLITLYQKGRKACGYAAGHPKQDLERIFPNLGWFETNDSLVHKADECSKQCPPRPCFVSNGEQIQVYDRSHRSIFGWVGIHLTDHAPASFQMSFRSLTGLLNCLGEATLCILALRISRIDIAAKVSAWIASLYFQSCLYDDFRRLAFLVGQGRSASAKSRWVREPGCYGAEQYLVVIS